MYTDAAANPSRYLSELVKTETCALSMPNRNMKPNHALSFMISYYLNSKKRFKIAI